MSWRDVLGIALGGAVGALLRHGVSVGCAAWLGLRFPWGTLLVNVVGCFLLGLLVELAATLEIPDTLQVTIASGFLGALTTFSSFGVQTLYLWQKSPADALLNVGLNLALGFAAAAVGMNVGGRWQSS